MYEEKLRLRLAQLRMEKNVSARDLSLSLGQNASYINKIENGKSLPSMTVFFYICEYFGITPSEFFDDELASPVRTKELLQELQGLSAGQLANLSAIIRDMKH